MILKNAAILLSLTILAGCATGNHVAINQDNALVINGRPVFPIGFSMPPPINGKTPGGKNGLRELAKGGATFYRTGVIHRDWTPADIGVEQKWEDAAARHGLYCWMYLRGIDSIGTNNLPREALLRRVVNKFKNHPGLLGWKGADEPQWGGMKIPPLVRTREIIRELDTNHPLVILQAPRGTVADLIPYDDACDVTGADIFPISYPPGIHSTLTNKEISMVGDFTRKMITVSQGRMPVWMTLQIAWSGTTPPKHTVRFPTFAQERFMAYQAIINGARGLIFFGGNVGPTLSPADAALGWNWTFWKRVLRPLLEEIGTHSTLEPALISADPKLPIKTSNADGVEFCARQSGRDLYIIACKREDATVKVKFENLPLTLGTGEVMYESPRQVSVDHGQFEDWFAPFDVHVYHFKAR